MSEIKKNGAASDNVSGNTPEQLNSAPNSVEQAESSAQRNQAYLKKKQAEMEHAELYRQRLRADKERRQALAAQRKANKEKAEAKAEAERRAREEEELERQNAIRQNTEDAERRNAEKDSYLERVSAKHAENEKAAEDYKNAQEKAEREMAEKIKDAQQKAEKAKTVPVSEPKADGDKNTEPVASDDEDTITLTFDEYNDNDGDSDGDEITASDSDADSDADTDIILTIDPSEIPGLFDDEKKADTKARPKPKAAPAPKPAAPKPEKKPQAAQAPMAKPNKKTKPKKRMPIDPMKAYLLGSSTYDLVTKETDFGKDHEEKKRNSKPAVDNSPVPPIKIGRTDGMYKYSSSTEMPSFDTGKKKGKKPAKAKVKGGDGDDESNLVPSLGAVSAVGAAGAITAALVIAGAATDKESLAAQIPAGSASANAAAAPVDQNNEEAPIASTDAPEKASAPSDGKDISDAAALAYASKKDEEQQMSEALAEERKQAAQREVDAAYENDMKKQASDSDALSRMAEQDEENDALSNALKADEITDAYADRSDENGEDAAADAEKRDADADAIAMLDSKNEEAEALASSADDDKETEKHGSDSDAVAKLDDKNEESEALTSDGSKENKKEDDKRSEEYVRALEDDKDSENDALGIAKKQEDESDEESVKKLEEDQDKADDAASTVEKDDARNTEDDVSKFEQDAEKRESDEKAAEKAEDEQKSDELAAYEKKRESDEDLNDTASEIRKREDEARDDANAYSKENDKELDRAAVKALDEQNTVKSDYSEILDEEKERRKKVLADDSDIAIAALVLGRDEFDRYVEAAMTYEDALFEDEALARDRQHKFSGDMSILMLKECMDIERELLISYTDILKRSIISENGKYYKIYSDKLEKMLIEYNADVYFWNEYTGEHVPRVPDTYLGDVKNGKKTTTVPAVKTPAHIAAHLPYATSRIEEAHNKARSSVASATQGISTQTPLVEADRIAVVEILKETEKLNDEARLILSTEGPSSAYSFKDYFNRASAFESDLVDNERMLRKKQEAQNGTMELVFLKECIEIERKLIESYVQSYRCAVKSGNKSLAKDYIGKIEDTVNEYNADLRYWSGLTSTKPEIIPASFTSSLRSKKDIPLLIPIVSLPSSVEAKIIRRNALYKKNSLAQAATAENNGLFEAILAKSLFSATEEKVKPVVVDTTDANFAEKHSAGESVEEFTERYERAIAERIAEKAQAMPAEGADARSLYEPTGDDLEIGELYLFGKGHILEGIEKRASIVARSSGTTSSKTTVANAAKANAAAKSFIAAGTFADPAELDMGILRAIYLKEAIRETTNEVQSKKHNAVLDPDDKNAVSDYDESIDKSNRKRDYTNAVQNEEDDKVLAEYKKAEKQFEKRAENAELSAFSAELKNTAAVADYSEFADKAAGRKEMADAAAPTQTAIDEGLYELARKVEDKKAEKAALAATAAATAQAATLAAYDKAQEEAAGYAQMADSTNPTQAMLDAELTSVIRSVEDKQAEKAALAATAAATAQAATLAAYDKAQEEAAGYAQMADSTNPTQAMLDAELTSVIKSVEDKQAEKAALAATAAATAQAATLAAYDKAADHAEGLAEMAASTVPTQTSIDSTLADTINAIEDKKAERADLATVAKEAKAADANAAYDARMEKKEAKRPNNNLYGADSDGVALAKIDAKIEKANTVTKPISKREALVEEVNKLLEASAAAALAAKVLEKKLKESSRREKEILSEIKTLRSSIRSAKHGSGTVYLKECLEAEAKLIELYYENYKLCRSADVKKQIKNYRKKITASVRKYNTDASRFAGLTGTHTSRISENFMAQMDAEIFILPTLTVPEHLASHTAFAEVKEFAEAQAQAELLSDTSTPIAKRLEKDAFNLEMKKAEAAKEVSDYEAALTRAEMDKTYKTVAAAPASPLDIASILETTTNKKLKKLEMLTVDKRRRDEEDIRAFNAQAAKDDAKARSRAEEKEIRREMAEDYEQRTAIDAYNKKLEALEQTNPELTDEEARKELLITAERLADSESFTALARHELRRYIRDEKKDEKSIIKDIRRTRKKYNNATVRVVALPHLRESIGFVHELLERYVQTFKAAVIARHKKYTKIYEKKTALLLDEYRADLDLWHRTTGESVPAVPLSVIEDVKMGREIAPIPKLDEELVLAPKNERRLKKLDLINFIKDEKKRAKRAKEHEKEMRSMTMDDGEHIVIGKLHMDTDLDTVKSRIEFRKERYINDLRLMRFHFGEETPKEMRKHRAEITKLAKMKRHGKKYVKYTKRNNERYLKIANLNLAPIYAKSDVHKERLEILQNRIRNLLLQRDEVNMRLLTLYAEENANPEKKRRTNKKRIAKVKLKAAKRAFKKQFKLYKLASKYRVPEAEKQRIYEIMNRKIDLRAYLAECKFRKRHERPGARQAKRVLRSQIKDTKLRLKYADRDFKKFMRKASKRSARTPNPKIQILWCLVLLTMVAIIGGGVYLFITYKDLIISYFGSFIAYIKNLITKPGAGGV